MRQVLEPSLRKELNVEIIRDLAKRGKRIDGRTPDEIRKIQLRTIAGKVETPIVSCELGNTIIVAGLKFGRMTPYPDSPDQGGLMVNFDFSLGSSEDIVPGPPDLRSVLAARLIDRGLREGAEIDFHQLFLKENEALQLMVDLVCLNDDGNVEDAGFLAVRQCLQRARIWDTMTVEPISECVPLRYQNEIVAISFVKIADSLLVDPSLDEELAADAQLTLLVDPSLRAIVGSQLYSARHPYHFTYQDMIQCRQTAYELAKDLITRRIV